MEKEIFVMGLGNLSELKKMAGFNQNEATDRLTIEKAITNFRFYGKRILKSYEYYIQHDPNLYETQVYMGDMRDNVNSYVQAFIDVTLTLLDMRMCDSLRSIIRNYTSEFTDLDDDTNGWLSFCQRRNDLILQYYNYDFMNEELISALANYNKGVLGLVEHLNSQCVEAGILNVVINKG